MEYLWGLRDWMHKQYSCLVQVKARKRESYKDGCLKGSASSSYLKEGDFRSTRERTKSAIRRSNKFQPGRHPTDA